MKKPEKFNTFINALLKEACRMSLVDVVKEVPESETQQYEKAVAKVVFNDGKQQG